VTKQQRARVVELLRCAADVVLTEPERIGEALGVAEEAIVDFERDDFYADDLRRRAFMAETATE
jgi:siroheme synthase (precorrin-2 oxidase/ferrochelatase)